MSQQKIQLVKTQKGFLIDVIIILGRKNTQYLKLNALYQNLQKHKKT